MVFEADIIKGSHELRKLIIPSKSCVMEAHGVFGKADRLVICDSIVALWRVYNTHTELRQTASSELVV